MTTLVVLAGGKGSRMGGTKDRLCIGGVPILHSMLNRLQWPGPTLLIGAATGRLPIGHEVFSKIVRDAEVDEGPMRGLRSALTHCDTDCAAVIPIDMPALTRDHLQELCSAIGTHLAIFPMRDGPHAKSTVEPLPCVLRRAFQEEVSMRLAQGDRSLQSLINAKGASTLRVAWPDSAWQNLNRVSDLPDGFSLRSD